MGGWIGQVVGSRVGPYRSPFIQFGRNQNRTAALLRLWEPRTIHPRTSDLGGGRPVSAFFFLAGPSATGATRHMICIEQRFERVILDIRDVLGPYPYRKITDLGVVDGGQRAGGPRPRLGLQLPHEPVREGLCVCVEMVVGVEIKARATAGSSGLVGNERTLDSL